MLPSTPDFLLGNPSLISPVAPWCVALDNLEMSILLLAQPWLAGDEGPRRADLERQLSRLAADVPLGPVYFQRVKRAVARLERARALRGGRSKQRGDRARRFVSTPEGFAALILNLRLVRSDPTLDAAEFEFKRALVALWNVVLERLPVLSGEARLPADTERFLDEVERIEIHGRPVVTAEVAAGALDISRLIAAQREHVERLSEDTRALLAAADDKAGALRDLDLSLLASEGFPRAASLLAGSPAVLAMVREVASATLPRMVLRARLMRYRRYLEYLGDLASLHAGAPKTRRPSSMRDILAHRET